MSRRLGCAPANTHRGVLADGTGWHLIHFQGWVIGDLDGLDGVWHLRMRASKCYRGNGYEWLLPTSVLGSQAGLSRVAIGT